MFNALKYIKRLEEVGFPREQAEAQLQIVIDVIEGELASKEDITHLNNKIESEIAGLRQEMHHEFTRVEYRIVSKIGVLFVTTVTLAVAFSTWLIKLR